MNINDWIDLSKLLDKYRITSSAPCRLDCGGSTDHRLTALLCRRWHPVTTNISLDLRTTVTLKPHLPGKILIESNHVGTEEATVPKMPLSGHLGLVSAILAHFGVHGVRVVIDSQSPPQSGLGGSGAVAVAAIGAISKTLSILKLQEPYKPHDIVLLAHHIEDSLYGNSGLQDQAAAMYGNVHLWEWRYGSTLNFTGRKIPLHRRELEKHIVLAYTGKTHPLSHKGSLALQMFKRNGNLELLFQISEHARTFAQAVQCGDYLNAADALSMELALRSQLIPEILPDDDKILVKTAVETGCGAKIAGHGEGGCIWAIGPKESINETKQRWESIFKERGSGYFLPVSIATKGMRTQVKDV
jgi:D-glycero-alpha-D-manno-heptose-7-phosphate kinase